jgi:hypothetical protein
MTIHDLVSRSKEGKIILENFASRQRVHKDKSIDIKRLYFIMANKHPELTSYSKFEQVFKDLETLKYGIIEKNRYFIPDGSIKEIGLEAIPEPVKPTKPKEQHTNKVIVLFKLEGLRCKAEMPEEALPLFEKLVNL